VASSFLNPCRNTQYENNSFLYSEPMISLRWSCLGILPELRKKVAENPHTTSLHPQKNMHQKSQGMTKNHPKNVATSHP
jgi:hypothetical protein